MSIHLLPTQSLSSAKHQPTNPSRSLSKHCILVSHPPNRPLFGHPHLKANHHRTTQNRCIMTSEREIAITEAINTIQNGQIGSIWAAASRFGVPRTTLQSRLHGTTDRSTAQQITQKLTNEQERCLVGSIKELETQGSAPSHTMVREMACKL
jgi:hypothetical protein